MYCLLWDHWASGNDAMVGKRKQRQGTFKDSFLYLEIPLIRDMCRQAAKPCNQL